ncbi:hypothetical protein BDZ90DRAFT_280409 [Jaminaea rosea]|uniref:Uncharacterized protein n=1 Tax=Jaminaea rosea TaxID=1569628 RepID=A0A316UUZ7_9BASI|nr:hypothetical protein BDZ90DRAFT_280409 [Jaminaea rosea]PWN26935.1 hypothetical protein BDZ90DRAFT_280409 [Jaminaea rosea]
MASPLPPHLALELRLRQVEYNVFGPDHLFDATSSKPLLLRAQSVKETIQSVGSSHGSASTSSSSSSLRRFVQTDFEACRRFLQPNSFRSGGSSGDTKDDESKTALSASATLSPSEQIVLILSAEKDMRTLERCLAQCQELGEKRDVAGAGRLGEYEVLMPLLERLRSTGEGEMQPRLREVEDQLLGILEEYQGFIDGLSRLYIQWDEALNDMERTVAKMERRAAQEEQG